MKKKFGSIILVLFIFFITGNLVYGQLADLKIRIKCPGNSYSGQDLKNLINVYVTNTGKVGVKNFPVDLIISKNAHAPMKYAVYSAAFKEDALLLGGREFVTYLGPGQTKVVKLYGKNRIPADTPTGVYFLGAIVDAGNKVRESNERNNMDFCRLRVKGKSTKPERKRVDNVTLPTVTPVTPVTSALKLKPGIIKTGCPDPAAYAINFQIVNKFSTFTGKVRITGVVKNVGSKAFSGGGGMAYLYEDNALRKTKTFDNLAAGATFSLFYERNWRSSSPSEGEFPPMYKLVIFYDPDILMDSNENNDDCKITNNQKKRSGKEINSLFR